MKVVYIFLLFVVMNLEAMTYWKVNIQKSLPATLQRIVPGKSSFKDVEKILGKANLTEKNKQYYVMDDFKYALEIIYEKSIVKEFSYTFTKQRPEFSNLNIDLKLLSSTDSTRFLKYSDKDGEFLLDLTSKTIYSVKIK